MLPLSRRARLALITALISAVAVAVPVLAGVLPAAAPAGPAVQDAEDPESTPAPNASEKPGKGPKAIPPGQVGKEDRPPEQPVELTGRVGSRTNSEGETEYTLTANGTVRILEAGPGWWWGVDHPLAPFVGDTVTIQGEQAEGSNVVDVRAVDGTALREPGKPPWAGGPRVVGERHPGWKAWKVERAPGTTGRPPWAGPKEPEVEEAP